MTLIRELLIRTLQITAATHHTTQYTHLYPAVRVRTHFQEEIVVSIQKEASLSLVELQFHSSQVMRPPDSSREDAVKQAIYEKSMFIPFKSSHTLLLLICNNNFQ